MEQRVLSSKKPLHGMFTEVPPRYDLVNRLITWGMDRGWRLQAARACLESKPQKILDVCCGTGDLSLNIAELAGYNPQIEGVDYSRPMLDLAVRKAGERAKNVKFRLGEVSNLPYSPAEFDCLGISFAFRNLTYKNSLADRHVAEIYRVLKPGGRLVIVESSQPSNSLVRALNHFYMRAYAGNIGSWISGNRPAYRYLAESACRYFSPTQMEAFLMERGFKSVDYRPLFLGAAGLYVGHK